MAGSLNWRWIAIGVAIMFGLNLIAGLLVGALIVPDLPVATPEGTPAVDPVAIGGGRLALVALLSFASFALGGYIVGWKSPGRTILEPGISAAIAVALSLLLAGSFGLGSFLVAGLLPFIAGLLGGWLGERRQDGQSRVA